MVIPFGKVNDTAVPASEAPKLNLGRHPMAKTAAKRRASARSTRLSLEQLTVAGEPPAEASAERPSAVSA